MDNEIQTPAEQKKVWHKYAKELSIALFAIAFLGIGFIAYQNPDVFKADLSGGTSVSSIATQIYIPSDYVITPGTVGDIAVKAGTDITNLGNVSLTFQYDSNKISITRAFLNTDDVLYGRSFSTSSGTNTFTVTFTVSPVISSVADDANLFHLSISADTDFTTGSTQIFLSSGYMYINGSYVNPPTYTPGGIRVSANGEACENVTCGDHAACDATTGQCICFKGYDQTFLCNACSEGYSGYPDCKLDEFSNLSGMVLTLNKDTIGKLSDADRKNVYSGAYILVNSPAVSGKTITIEEATVTIPNPVTVDCTSTPAQKVKCIEEITNGLKPLLGISGVNVTSYPNVTGMLRLEATGANTDLDGITTNSGDVYIVPAMMNKITILPTDSYQLRIIGKSGLDGSASELNYGDVTWVQQPLNRLGDTALKSGLLEKGDKSGTTELFAEVEKSDQTTVDSNMLTVEVPSGPIIEYIHIIGSKPFERGGRVSLSAKISDVDQISDINDIRSSIVRSNETTYLGINNDTSAVWFTATPFIDQVVATDSGTQAASSSDGTTSSSTTTSTSEYYRIYTIPVEIPQDQNMTDGQYKLVLQITDNSGNAATSVLPITLGAAANGDVDGSGKVNMLDVILAFEIANGTNASPTQAQILAADMDKNGKITMLDVITLFNQL